MPNVVAIATSLTLKGTDTLAMLARTIPERSEVNVAMTEKHSFQQRRYMMHFTYDELSLLEDAISYYNLAASIPDEADYTESDRAELMDKVADICRAAADLEPL